MADTRRENTPNDTLYLARTETLEYLIALLTKIESKLDKLFHELKNEGELYSEYCKPDENDNYYPYYDHLMNMSNCFLAAKNIKANISSVLIPLKKNDKESMLFVDFKIIDISSLIDGFDKQVKELNKNLKDIKLYNIEIIKQITHIPEISISKDEQVYRSTEEVNHAASDEGSMSELTSKNLSNSSHSSAKLFQSDNPLAKAKKLLQTLENLAYELDPNDSNPPPLSRIYHLILDAVTNESVDKETLEYFEEAVARIQSYIENSKNNKNNKFSNI